MDLTDHRQVTALLERHGFRFSKSLGQNFLTAAWVPGRIADEAGLAPDDGVLEIGPGVGCLTAELARRAGRVLSLELDERLRGVLGETLAGFDNVSVVFTDAVKADLAALCREHLGDRPWKVCANLPYNVTTPLLTALLKAGCFQSITVMVQKEVAERICAGPGTGEYGAFSLLAQWYAEPRLCFEVPPHCFVPQPKVTSAVLRLDVRGTPPAEVPDEGFFFAVVRAAFNQRRKTLPNAVSAGIPGLRRPEIEAALDALGLSPAVRGETLSLAQFAALSRLLYSPGIN
ncbi:MAG: 16S rRNA (adenine(1518)-N(6)/adenine(1519)-N(6))-dimethyltransferase RsmA [Oscillospiraceae bacterium]|nr:16S rRNA (adenine(1518)-N(6)/adenine(1519)-N(6))-dimethyltransferase RsmA [Oscillospiraceae bacterium]